MSKKIELFTDGASRGNPGKAGIGVVIADGKRIIRKFGTFIGTKTNNVAEYTALIYGLQEALILGTEELIINLDSELLVKQLEGLYRVKNGDLKLLFEQVSRLLQGFKKIEIKNITRVENREADRLANQAIKEAINPVRNKISNGVKKKISVARTSREIIKLLPKQKELFTV